MPKMNTNYFGTPIKAPKHGAYHKVWLMLYDEFSWSNEVNLINIIKNYLMMVYDFF